MLAPIDLVFILMVIGSYDCDLTSIRYSKKQVIHIQRQVLMKLNLSLTASSITSLGKYFDNGGRQVIYYMPVRDSVQLL